MADHDDPFAEPNDTDKTVIKPNPGGRLSQPAPVAPQPAAPDPVAAHPTGGGQGGGYGGGGGQGGMDAFGVPQAAAPAAAPASGPRETAPVLTGMNQLLACASTLFALISRIRNRAQHMDPDKLRQSVVAEVREFENRALQAGIPAQTVKVARYALCATLDDVVLNTPWGGQSSWGLQSMVGTFHRETVGGDRFYDLLARLEKEPSSNIDLLEFLYMCLSLGFEGRLRIEQGGSDKHLRIRGALARIIRAQRGPVEHDVSPHWEGVEKPFKPLSAWRVVWIAVAVVALLLTLQFAGLSWALSTSTERVLGQLGSIESGPVATLERRAPPPPPPPPQPTSEQQLQKVTGFLQAEIDDGIVEVFRKGNTLIIRIKGSGMFASGSDALQDRFVGPVNRVAEALNDEPGPVIVAGHSDNVPIRSSRFPSNMHLSLARAKSVMAGMARVLEDPDRLSAEGRADKEPIGDNATRDGRAKNRRIEVLLVQEEGQ
ncbi:type VI secretion system protein TssL, long form [Antarcticimicrobium sediminis]|uniref:Type VI secretion system protein TssL n=1 Tax=Antarcticimicrobium sediminis TaxID=2546227 RepID=A0A4R5ERN1_9RHOB|nr:type VI secretion system protein TssL, long form [Antarcticimicrobium sediminis]TDE37495.1 type VI secretion system protein TssL [Antarcticimicrobium sediminis]